jgi:hypothetical protein
VKSLSESKLRWIVIGLCALAAVRVFVFSAAFPFFNNVDEQAHLDLVLKYAHRGLPRAIEPFSAEAARYLAVYSSPEYFVTPQQYEGDQYPPPAWALSPHDRERVLNEEVPFWESRVNHESGEPPLYYKIAGQWLNIGAALGFSGLTLLYWIRFLNVIFAILLVWLGYKAARIVFPGNQFAALALATLLAIWPQSSFYSIQGDSLSPVVFAFAFIALAKLLQSARLPIALSIWLGLTLAATCLVKTANLPLLFVVAIGVIYKAVQLIRKKMRQHGLAIAGAFAVSVALPIAIWFIWNQNHFGDFTATKSKIEILGWTAKPFSDWWSHPIFSLSGLKEFWPELIASFWRGEFIWHHERMATWWSDAFYWTASTTALAIAICGLVKRRQFESQSVLWFALVSILSLAGFLVLLSIRYDFGQCVYPSRIHPYFTSGRLLNGAAVPFFLLFVYAIERVATWTKREWTRWLLLGAVVLLAGSWQLSINSPAFSSRYNFFHRPAIQ